MSEFKPVYPRTGSWREHRNPCRRPLSAWNCALEFRYPRRWLLSRLATNTILTAPETVVGYHGCSRGVAEKIISAQHFLPSTMTYDWLGEGIYFWEYAPYRALEWAQEKVKD